MALADDRLARRSAPEDEMIRIAAATTAIAAERALAGIPAPRASTPLCLACGQEVRLNQDRKWATEDGSTDCPKRSSGHQVEQIIPDASVPTALTAAPQHVRDQP